MTRIRGKNIDEATTATIIGILDGWGGKLSWDLLTEAVCAHLGHRYTRQALDANERISNAYKTHRGRLRGKAPEELNREMSPEVRMLHESNERLKAENSRLLAENRAYLETFTNWAYNAANRGLTEAYLNTPLPRVDKEQTREKKLRKIKG
jgi:hypothetical protein